MVIHVKHKNINYHESTMNYHNIYMFFLDQFEKLCSSERNAKLALVLPSRDKVRR